MFDPAVVVVVLLIALAVVLLIVISYLARRGKVRRSPVVPHANASVPKMTMSAIVTGFPLEFRQPKPLPGETMAQLIIRNHPGEWRNCMERLTRDLGVSSRDAEDLRQGRLKSDLDPRVHEEIDRFMSFRFPSHGRTIQCLVKLREHLGKGDLFELVDVLWPREQNPSGDCNAERSAERMGATVIPYATGVLRELDLASLLPYVHGEILWLVPGGTRFMSSMAALDLGRVVRFFAGSPRRAAYMDGGRSLFYRTPALLDLIARGESLSADSRVMGRRLQQAGYELAAESDPDTAICELEPEYGGPKR